MSFSRAEKQELAAQAAREARPRATGWARAPCPFCAASGKDGRDPVFSVNLATGHYVCHRCKVGGSLELDDEFLERAAQVPPGDDEEARKPPDGYLPLGEGDGLRALCAAPARAYLAKRGVARETVRTARLGVVVDPRSKYANRVILPVLAGAAWRGWVARDYTGRAEKKYLNPRGSWRGDCLYNEAALLVETEVPCLIVEGGFDALPFGQDAVAVLGQPTEDQILLVKALARRPAVFVLDGDAWEAGWALGLRLRLEGLRAGSVRLPPRKDPDEVDRAWLYQRAQECLEE